MALHQFPGLNKQNAVASKVREIETRAEEEIHNRRADIQWAWAAVMIAIVKRHATWSRKAKMCGEEIHSVPYEEIKWTGRKDRARLYEAHKADFNYQGDYEVKKLPTEMHARAAAIMGVEYYPRNNRGIHDIPPNGYHTGISVRSLCQAYPVTMKELENEASNYITQTKLARDQKKERESKT